MKNDRIVVSGAILTLLGVSALSPSTASAQQTGHADLERTPQLQQTPGAATDPDELTPAESAEEENRLNIPFPHPVIMEVLFFPDRGLDHGDANKDRKRIAIGEEFVEIINPHDRPIQLAGYVIRDRNTNEPGGDSKAFRFVFPECELAPGQVAVLFNGFRSQIPGPLGDKLLAAGPNDRFAGALVFSAQNQEKGVAFSNVHEWVLLESPAGDPIDLVQWGELDVDPPDHPMRSEKIEEVFPVGYQRLSPGGKFMPHPVINGKWFSPGEIPEWVEEE